MGAEAAEWLQVMSRFRSFAAYPGPRNGDRFAKWMQPMAEAVAAFGEKYPNHMYYMDPITKPSSSYNLEFVALNPSAAQPLREPAFTPYGEFGLLGVVFRVDEYSDAGNSLMLILRAPRTSSRICPEESSNDILETVIYQSGLPVHTIRCPHWGNVGQPTDDLMTRGRRSCGLEGGMVGACLSVGSPRLDNHIENILPKMCDFLNSLAQNG